MTTASNLGFPRIGANRELKKALESYWAGTIDRAELESVAASLRETSWRRQQQAGLEHIPSNDFSYYDQVLDTCAMVGAVPPRYGLLKDSVELDTYFAMARGAQDPATGRDVVAMEMTKWFDTNYHYIVPEFARDQKFTLASTKPIDEFTEAQRLGIRTRPVLLGPVSFLCLASPGIQVSSRSICSTTCCPSTRRSCSAWERPARSGSRWTSPAWCSTSTTRRALPMSAPTGD